MIGCDLGSNTFRVVEIDCKTKERIKEFEQIVKTAQDLYDSKTISKEAISRVIDAIKEADKIFDFKNKKVAAVATAALRIAKNSKDVLEIIKKETGLEFKIIDANDEAKYTQIAVEQRLKRENILHDSYLLIDIGGASTEVVLKNNSNTHLKSFDIGIVTMSEKYNNQKEMLKELTVIKEFIQNFKKPNILVASGGTATTLAAFSKGMDYKHYDYKRVNATMLDINQIDKCLKKLLDMDIKNREKWVGVSRDKLIIVGILLLKNIIKICNFKEIVVIDDSLREGVAISEC